MTPLQWPVVVTPHLPVDACLVEGAHRDEMVLMVSAAQTVTSAGRAVCTLMPWMPPEEVRRLVRDHFPHAVELPTAVSAATTPPRSPATLRGVSPAVWVALLLVAAAVAAGITLMVLGTQAEAATRAADIVLTW